jgi:LacI family transcriptional regulator
MPAPSTKIDARRVRIADVAKLAGCAPATVSRRLNNPAIVSADVVQAIDIAIEQLGYVRNDSARSLRSSRSRLVGAVIPTLRHSIYAELLAGLQHVLEKNGFAVIYNTSEYNLDEEHRQARTLVERGVEAIVLVGTRHRAKTLKLISAHNITCAVTYAFDEDFVFTCVGFDNRRAAALAANRLYDLGHRRFGMLAGITANNDRAQGRVEGFVEALAAKGIDPAKIVIREGRYQIGDGRAAMASLLDQDPQITALFCGSDVLAFGAMFECRRRAISIPADLSIIGFDNLEISAYTDPPLTTLNVPAYEIGRKAAQYILRNEQGSAAIEYVTIPAELVERSTTMARTPNQVQDGA